MAHDVSRIAAAEAAIPAHARLETYSVLTRMPSPHRLETAVVADLLERWFPGARTLVPSETLARDVVRRCHDAGIGGGAVWDALVGLTAAEAGEVLVSRDERAARTYRRLGLAVELAP